MKRYVDDIAGSLIPPPSNRKVLKKKDGKTEDIVRVILETAPKGLADTREFAPYIKKQTPYHTANAIWHFLKRNIAYQTDPVGVQYVQTPSYTWYRKKGDCKSYSIFISTLLKNLDIDHSLRFVSFRDGGEFTHVYVVVPYRGRLIVVDDVMPGFDQEKPFKRKKDYTMAEIYQMSGVGVGEIPDISGPKLFDLGNRPVQSLTDGELDLLIARDRLKAEKNIVENVKGIGSLKAERYQDSIDMIDDCLDAVDQYKKGKIGDIEDEFRKIADDAVNGVYSISSELMGVGSLFRRSRARVERRRDRREERKHIRKTTKGRERRRELHNWRSSHGTRTGRFLQKVGHGVKQGGKALLKVSTAPMRLAAKGILEVSLPKAAPYFLYLFITDPEVIAKLPPKVKAKRDKQMRIANFIVRGLGMKRRHFMGIVRNGIIKRYGKSPEKVLKEQMSGRLAGIGALPADAVRELRRLITVLARTTRTRPVPVMPDGAPSRDDFPREHRPVTPAPSTTPHAQAMNVLNQLPQVAPYFLYLFIKDPNIPMPEKVKQKREIQKAVAEYIISNTNISRQQFMAIVRRGIRSKLGKDPEQVLIDYANGVEGIGVLAMAAVGTIISIINKIIAFFKKGKKVSDKIRRMKAGLNDVASPDDWQGADTELITNRLTSQYDDNLNLDRDFSTGGRSIWDSLKF